MADEFSPRIERALHQLFEFGISLKAFNGAWETLLGLALLSTHRKFAGAYVVVHGVLNIFLAFQLYRNRLWAYLVTIGLSLIFMGYQVYRIHLYHSRVLTALTILDVFFIALTCHEYWHQMKKRGTIDPL